MKAKPSRRSLQQTFDDQIDLLALTLVPGTVNGYRVAVRKFLRYLAAHYPRIHTLGALQRDPHLLGFLRDLAAQHPPLRNETRRLYLLCLRRLFTDMIASDQHSLWDGLIIATDLPHRDQYLPKPLCPEDDYLLQQYLCTHDDLLSNALRFLRLTGMRIGELLRLPTDCLRPLTEAQWALHVPLGKLHTERWVPVDDEVRQLHERLLVLRQNNTAESSATFLLPQPATHSARYYALKIALEKAAQQAGCSHRVTPHQLRHTYATEMIRAGVSLPVLMQLLGHNAIGMALRYVQVTQKDLQREYQQARQNMATHHSIPPLPNAHAAATPTAEIREILQSLTDVRHLIEMYRRQLADEKSSRKIARLVNRLVKISAELGRSDTHK